MVHQSKMGITRPLADRALVLEYEDVLTGASSKLSRSQCLRLGGKEIYKSSTVSRWCGSTNPFHGWFGRTARHVDQWSIDISEWNQNQRHGCCRSDQFPCQLATTGCGGSKASEQR